MQPNKRAKLDTALKPLIVEPETIQIRAKKANKRTWSDLSQEVGRSRAAVFRHEYTRNKTAEHLDSLHTHGDFQTIPRSTGPDTYELTKHNVSTKASGKAESFGDLLTNLGSRHTGATNAMRVLKGTHVDWELESSNKNPGPKAATAVTLAAEIGISEFSRGGSHALLNAMSGLYLLKHREFTKAEFADPKVGYRGAGQGGAANLRTLQTKGLGEALHLARLRKVYDSHAVKKGGQPWSGKKNDTGFETWLEHKSKKWLQRMK